MGNNNAFRRAFQVAAAALLMAGLASCGVAAEQARPQPGNTAAANADGGPHPELRTPNPGCRSRVRIGPLHVRPGHR
ncbi:UNVERIFIED_ORG: hypothetical protein J2X79_002656 [Arthrobacter globiformis]|nr:hypothetical protein [Arthrobacter globiformis]